MGAVGLYDAILGGDTIKQIESASANFNVTPLVGRFSGGLDPQLVGVNYADPVVAFTSQDVAGILGFLSVTAGKYYTSSTITIPYQTRAIGGTFSGAGTNYTLSSTRGLLVPTEFKADQDSDTGAQAMLEWHATWDESTLPIVVSDAQNLASQAFNVMHTLGPVALNSSVVGGLVSVSVKPGLTVVKKRYSGAPFTTAIFITERNPQITFTFEDFDALDANAGMFNSLNGGTCIAYFRKQTDGGTRVANGTTGHISFTLSNGLAVADSAAASARENGTASITVHGKTLAFSASTTIS